MLSIIVAVVTAIARTDRAFTEVQFECRAFTRISPFVISNQHNAISIFAYLKDPSASQPPHLTQCMFGGTDLHGRCLLFLFLLSLHGMLLVHGALIQPSLQDQELIKGTRWRFKCKGSAISQLCHSY